MPEIEYRHASLDDAAEIHALLLRLAPEIPLQADTLEREEALYALTRNCVRSGESWAACDAAGRILGFVLAETNQHSRHYAEHEVIELRHLGVAPEHRNRGIFAGLIERVLARMLPVTVTVSAANRSNIARQLEKLRFHETGPHGGERSFRWEPGTD